MSNPTIDKTLVAVIIGPIVGLLVANGYIAPTNADQIIQLSDAVIGGAIALISIIGFFAHHRAVTLQDMKNKSTQPATITSVTSTEIVQPASAPETEVVTPQQPTE